jgi:hypothetical protein
MTLQDLASTLPNGFHDAKLYALSLDYVKGDACLDLDVWVGDLESDDKPVRNAYRSCILKLIGLELFVVEPQDSRYRFKKGEWLTIDVGGLDELSEAPRLALPTFEAGVSVSWVYVKQWNAFMYLAAKDVSFEWKPE